MVSFHPHVTNNLMTNKDKNFQHLIIKAKFPSLCSHQHAAFVAISNFEHTVLRNVKKKNIASGLLRQAMASAVLSFPCTHDRVIFLMRYAIFMI